MAASATERVTVRMMRSEPTTHWGFRIQDFQGPLTIGQVNEGGLAERAGLLEGDRVLQIGGVQASNIKGPQAEEAIAQSGNNLDIVVERAATRIWRPEITPVNVPVGDMTSAPVKYSLAHDRPSQDHSNIGSGHNIQPRPFGQPQQATQQQPAQRYTSSTSSTKVTEQYNSPTPLHPRKTAVEEYLQKTGGLFGTDPKLTQKVVEPLYLKSETLRLIKESETRTTSSGQTDQKGTPIPVHVEGPRPTGPAPAPAAGAPVCDHCGRSIHGVFCKVGGKTLHGECFKCSTCGSLLKNIGHFMIKDKLYCDVHARQQRSTESTGINYPGAPVPGTDPNSSYNKSYQYHKTTKTTTTTSSNQPGAQPYSISVTTTDQQQGAPVSQGPTMAPPQPPPAPPAPRSQFGGGQPPPQSIPGSNLSSSSYNKVTTQTQYTSNNEGGAPIGKAPGRRGRGILKQSHDVPRIPICESCNREIRGPFVLALTKTWCPEHFICASAQCQRRLLEIGFIEENGLTYCEFCYEKYFAPVCSKCSRPIVGDCLTALERQWHPDCFVCTHCRKPFGSTSFFVENGQPFCEADWNQLFTTKCIACHYAIESGDRWVEALGAAYHSDCFNCAVCQKNLEGQSFYAKAGRPYCKDHA